MGRRAERWRGPLSTQRFGYVSPYAAGLRCRCPRCGRGHLFEGLLSVRPICEVCELDLSAHDTGDGPAVFAIFLIGFIVVPLALAVDALFEPAFWVHIALWLPVVSLLAIAFLRPMKATLVALHYKNFKHHYGPG